MIPLGFTVLSLVMIGSVLYMINKSNYADKKKITTVVLIWSAGWLAYLVAISFSGILASFSFPPRMPLLVVFPALASIFYFTSRDATKKIIQSSSVYFPVNVQSFRVFVEILIYGAYMDGVLPEIVTFDGRNYDILVGWSAPVIGFLYEKNALSKKGVLAWNILSLGVLGFTIFTFVSFFYFSGSSIEPGFMRFVRLPYLLLPGILAPCAIFYHIVSIKQCLSKA